MRDKMIRVQPSFTRQRSSQLLSYNKIYHEMHAGRLVGGLVVRLLSYITNKGYDGFSVT